MVAGGNRCPNPEDIELVDPNNHDVFHCGHDLIVQMDMNDLSSWGQYTQLGPM